MRKLSLCSLIVLVCFCILIFPSSINCYENNNNEEVSISVSVSVDNHNNDNTFINNSHRQKSKPRGHIDSLFSLIGMASKLGGAAQKVSSIAGKAGDLVNNVQQVAGSFKGSGSGGQSSGGGKQKKKKKKKSH